MKAPMDDELLLRYSRQILMPEIDVEGQERWRNSHVLVVGMGGLGCAAALYLGAAGIGQLTLADGDAVEISNLQRQVAHTHAAAGTNKAVSVQRTLAALNPDCIVNAIDRFLEDDDLRSLVPRVDLVVDCTDNGQARQRINVACVRIRKPLVSGAAIRGEGQLSVHDLRREDAPCYRCLYPDPARRSVRSDARDPGRPDQGGPDPGGNDPGSDRSLDARTGCNEAGILGPLVGVIGSLQALEALNLLSGKLGGNRPLLVFDAFACEFRAFRFVKQASCPVCGASA